MATWEGVVTGQADARNLLFFTSNSFVYLEAKVKYLYHFDNS